MELMSESIIENGICKRCGRKTRILSNGLCSRCDDVLYGKPKENIDPRYPRPYRPTYAPYPVMPHRRQLWCCNDKLKKQ